jgi:hypothetical protein
VEWSAYVSIRQHTWDRMVDQRWELHAQQVVIRQRCNTSAVPISPRTLRRNDNSR